MTKNFVIFNNQKSKGAEAWMRLGKQNVREILNRLMEQGEESFIDAIEVQKVRRKRKRKINKCPVCHNHLQKASAWALTDVVGRPLFQDRFETRRCARRAIKWLRHILIEFKRYLGDGDEDKLVFEDL